MSVAAALCVVVDVIAWPKPAHQLPTEAGCAGVGASVGAWPPV